jgi:hypothetical protein
MNRYCLIILFFLGGKLFAQNNCTPIVAITASKNNVCLDTAITFHATVVNNGTNAAYQWKRNNVNVGTNNADYTAFDFRDGDIVVCEYTCKTTCGTDADELSNQITTHVINDITPLITVANNDSLICQGIPTLFTAEASYGNAIPFYHWSVNGVPVGFNKPSYETDSLTNGSLVKCVLTISVPGCPVTSAFSSSQMNIYVYPLIHPIIKITAPRTNICRGESATFTATANGSTSASLSWEINGVVTGDVGPSFTTGNLKDGDSVSCTITIDQNTMCHGSISAPSNKIGIHVKDYEDPSVTISAPLLEACAGDPLTFTATGENIGGYAIYQWLVNERYEGNSSQTFIYDKFKNGDSVSCILTTYITGCLVTPSASSDHKVVTIRDTPVITFVPPDISVMSGEPAQVTASVAGSTASYEWKPDALLLTPHELTSATVPLGRDTILIFQW